jgi:hypothetical protein
VRAATLYPTPASSPCCLFGIACEGYAEASLLPSTPLAMKWEYCFAERFGGIPTERKPDGEGEEGVGGRADVATPVPTNVHQPPALYHPSHRTVLRANGWVTSPVIAHDMNPILVFPHLPIHWRSRTTHSRAYRMDIHTAMSQGMPCA